jgi:glycosyltransferase involved in cell wall biosynthesis
MRIVFLTRALTPGGAERQLVITARGLRERGHDVRVLTFFDTNPLASALHDTGVEVEPLGKRGRWDIARFCLRLRRRLRKLRPDVLYSYLVVPNLVAAVVTPRRSGTRVVWGVRAAAMDLSQYDKLSRVSFWLTRHAAIGADAIVVNSRAGLLHHAAVGYPAERMCIIPNGIDAAAFAPRAEVRARVRAELGLADGTLCIGTVARVDRAKGLDTFIRAAGRLRRLGTAARFVIVGAGDELLSAELRQLAAAEGVDRDVTWLGERLDVGDVYQGLDIFTSASRTEGFSNAIAEAMASGVACVVTDVGDSAFIVGPCGAVVRADDPDALAAAWRALAPDAKARAATAECGRRRVQKEFGIDAMIDRTEQVLRA